MGTTLYKIQEDYLQLINQIEELEGELTPELEKALTINSQELQGKSISYLEVIKTKESFNAMIDDEIKRLQAIKKQNNSLVSNLQDRLLQAVKMYGDFTVGTVTFTTRKSKSVEIEDEEQIDTSFFNIKQVVTVDKKRIKEAIESGQEVKGAFISENFNLRIK